VKSITAIIAANDHWRLIRQEARPVPNRASFTH
jgi:hypothetical protein